MGDDIITEIITYSLKNNNETSDKYYEDVSNFTDKVIDKINKANGKDIKDFENFIVRNNIEKLRNSIEYQLEILMLGVLWNNYVDRGIALRSTPKAVLIELSKLREKKHIKDLADFWRGILGSLFLNKEKKQNAEFKLDNLIKLIEWLSATGDFKEEVKRIRNWETYLSSKSEDEVKFILREIVSLAQWFEIESKEKLGYYTENVDKFHRYKHKNHKWKEDYIYCGRNRVEYHLNMVGAEMMNRAYRERFLHTKEKILLLPACMRLNYNSECKAIKTEYGHLCKHCMQLCKVNKYTNIGYKYNFKTYIIHHESSISVSQNTNINNIGIIGVACVLNLISGGWKAKNLGFIPQCVILDYCGCKKHWDEKGIITDINIDRLLYTVDVNLQ